MPAPADEPRRRGGRAAVVIGGGMAGLLAARVLSEHFERVRIVERDGFPEGPSFRKGVPQARHLHTLMARGRLIVNELFPGIEDELVEAGAWLVDLAADAAWLTPAGWGARFRSGIPLLVCSRPLLEWAVRRRVATLEDVCFLERTDVVGLILSSDGESVKGIKVRLRGPYDDAEAGGEEPLRADLLVDASGHHSEAPRWLGALGYEAPEEEVVNAHMGYATRVYRRPEASDRGWEALYVQADPPGMTRGGAVCPVEGDRWMCTLYGVGEDYPPTDEDAFMSFARSLRTPLLHDAIKGAEPLSPIWGYRDTANSRRRYEKLARQPDNFLVTGDAACAFNPIYKRGMTTAALGAIALGESLREQREHRPDGSLEGLSKRFQKKLAKVNAAPWLLATGDDLRVSDVEGGPADLPTRLMHRYMDRVLALSTRDATVRWRLLTVMHMLQPPGALFSPAVVLRVLGAAAASRGKTRKVETGRPSPEAE